MPHKGSLWSCHVKPAGDAAPVFFSIKKMLCFAEVKILRVLTSVIFLWVNSFLRRPFVCLVGLIFLFKSSMFDFFFFFFLILI